MARRDFGHYQQFLIRVLSFWRQVGPDFSVGEWTKARLETEKAEFEALNNRVSELEQKLSWARTERDARCKSYENFDSRLRGGVMSQFGLESDQFQQVPRLLHAGPGRPNKSAETRKANTLKRKAAEKLAQEEQIRAEIRAKMAAE